jgi:hypothetical protein
LPARVYLEHGAYCFRDQGKRVNLGRDLGEALTRYAALVGNAWSCRTLGDVIDRYRVEVLTLKRSEKTRDDQGRQLDRLKKGFGHMLPDNVTAQHCYAYQDARRDKDGKLVPVAARHEVVLLGHVFGKAIRWGAASANPARGLQLGKRSPKRRQVPMAWVDSVRNFSSERLRVAVDLAVSTGQRRGDILSLTRAQLTDAGVYFKQSKTGEELTIEWSDDLRAIVARAKALTPQIPGEYLVRKQNGKPYAADGFAAIWKRAMLKHTKAGGERFSFHDLRSVSADGAVTAEEARDRLGHTSVETTRRHYLRAGRKAKPRS